MGDLIIYFGLLDFLLLLLVVLLVVGLVGWALGRWRQSSHLKWLIDLPNALPDGVVVAQADGRVLLASAEARQLWGDGSFPQRLVGILADIAREAGSGPGYSLRSVDAPSGLKLQVRATLLRPELVLLVLEDLTVRQRQEAFYRNFVSNVSHELKTPLTVIQGHVAALGEELADDDAAQTSVRVVAQETTRLTHLVDNLLLLSRLEMPDFSLDRRPVNLEAMIENAILQLSDLADTRGVSLSLQRKDGLPRILADRARLQQVFINLLDNAIKYNRRGGAVVVRMSADEKNVTVEVQDTGEGIPVQDLPYIFEKMYRVERRRGRYVEGSGLGLSIVQRIVEQHGGAISVDSRIGEGSVFAVMLPRAADQDGPGTVTSR